MKKLFIIICLFASLWGTKARAQATDIYITQTGATSGVCTTSVQTPAFFNASANWGSGAGQIGPGTIVHLCGTFTFAAGAYSVFSFQGSGTSGSPITLKWETGAIVQAPYFATSNGTPGGIETNGKNYIVIDGGTNGILRNTANGTGLAWQKPSTLLDASASPNFQVKHLAMLGQYVRSGTDTVCGANNDWCYSLRVMQGGSNITVGPGNTFSDCDVCVYFPFAGGESNLIITGNTFNHANQAIEGGPTGAGTKTLTNIQVDHNTYNASRNWDESTNSFHHNFFHPFTNTVGSSILGNLTIFDNICIGDMGLHSTSMIYLENNNSGTGGTMGTWYIFNNLFYKTNNDAPGSSGIVAPMSNGGYLLNNTIVDAGANGSSSLAYPMFTMYGINWTITNNLYQGGGGFYFDNGSTPNTNKPTAAVTNLYYSTTTGSGTGQGTQWAWAPGSGGFTDSFSAWQSFCVCDASPSISGTNPNLNLTTFVSANAAVVMGTNLNSFASGSGVPAVATYLPLDINGATRGSGTWSVGAVNYPGGGGGPAVPTNISVIVVGP